MSTATFDAQVTDFERAPWLPVTELARERAFLAGLACDYIELDGGRPHSYYLGTARELAHEVTLMRAEDQRLGQAVRDAYQAWKAAS